MADQVARVPDVPWRRTSCHLVAAVDDRLVEVGDLGAIVWDAVEEPVDVETLTLELAEAFDVPADVARRRLDGVVEELVAVGLLRRT